MTTPILSALEPLPMENVLLVNLAVVAVTILLLWVASLLCRDVSIVDIFWGLGFVLLAWLSFGNRDQPPTGHALLLTLLATAWGVRLAAYLAWRNWGKPEDYRYVAMREHHGSRFPIVSLFTVFGLQGVLMWIIALPLQLGIATEQAWQPLDAIGILLWLAGLMFESVGDYQLACFKANPANRGNVMNRGLWRYTRHPNYFGDFLIWWGFYLVAAGPGTWLTIIGPVLMSFLLIRVSGVRLLESSLRSRVAGYEEYVSTTNAFFPWPPRPGNG